MFNMVHKNVEFKNVVVGATFSLVDNPNDVYMKFDGTNENAVSLATGKAVRFEENDVVLW